MSLFYCQVTWYSTLSSGTARFGCPGTEISPAKVVARIGLLQIKDVEHQGGTSYQNVRKGRVHKSGVIRKPRILRRHHNRSTSLPSHHAVAPTYCSYITFFTSRVTVKWEALLHATVACKQSSIFMTQWKVQVAYLSYVLTSTVRT